MILVGGRGGTVAQGYRFGAFGRGMGCMWTGTLPAASLDLVQAKLHRWRYLVHLSGVFQLVEGVPGSCCLRGVEAALLLNVASVSFSAKTE